VIVLLAACEPSEPPIDIDISMSPVIAMNADEAMVVLFPATDPPTSCDVFRLTEKNAPDGTLIGTYRTTIDVKGTMAHQTNIWGIVPGRYQVAVFVYDMMDAVVGFGCLPMPVTIEEGKRTETPTIDIRPPPGG
jgi:hypothetical protein